MTFLSHPTGVAPGRGSLLSSGVIKAVMTAATLTLSLLGNTLAATPGIDGALTVTAANTVINQYSTVTGLTATTITVSNIGNLTSNAPVNGGVLAPGDLLVIYQAQGASIDTSNTPGYGAVTSYNGAGKYQSVTVGSVSGNTITLAGECAALSGFDATKTQIIRVPQLSSLTVNSGASIRGLTWDGTKGGFVAANVMGATTLNGSINASAQGFRGAAPDTNNSAPYNQTDYVTAAGTTGAQKGEGIAGLASTLAGGPEGRGAPANGGGSGDSHNAGGGGGSNAGSQTGYNGTGTKDTSVAAYTTAWNAETRPAGDTAIAAPFATNVSPGGGRGGYTYTGDASRPVGGLGGRPLDVSGNRLFLGGGGGAGEWNGTQAAATVGGGNGGGLVYLTTGSLTGTGSVLANGAAGGNSGSTDAASGAGGGGAIVIDGGASVPSSIALNATGGTGGSQAGGSGEKEGPGGGGGGYVAATGGNVSVAGGANGITTDGSASTFPPNGATRGTAGVSTFPPAGSGTLMCYTLRIGVAKAVGTPVVSGTGNSTYDIPYTVVVQSYGENLTNVQVSDLLTSVTPAGVTLVGIPVGPTVFGVTTGSSLTANTATDALSTGNLLTTSPANTLVRQDSGADAQATITFTLRVRPPAGAGTGTVYNNTATGAASFTPPGGATLTTTDTSVTGANPDVNGNRVPNEASDNVSTPVSLPVADLSLTKTVNNATPTVGSNVTFTVTLNNRATSSTASGVTVLDQLPAGYTFVSAAPSSGGYVAGTGIWTVGTLNAGVSVTLSIVATVKAGGPYANTAQVNASNLPDPNSIPGNSVAGEDDQATATLTLNNPPVTKDVTNALLLDTAAATVLSPNLSAADTDGTVTTYTIVTLPAAASGVLSVNGAAITATNTSFTAAQLATLSFDPAAGFAGNATFTYTATDNQGAVSNVSTYTLPVNVIPVAVSDTSSTPANTAKIFSVTANDTDVAPGTINVASTVFATSGQPAGAVLTNGNRTVAVPGQGSYVLDNAGNVTFTPVSGYSGTTAAVKYTVTDNQGAVSNVANITVTVTPVAVNDTANTTPSTPVNTPVLSNDVGTGKVITSLLFPATGQPVGSVLSGGGKTLTNADGVYTIKPDGTVDFTPALGKTGLLSPVLYTFVDGAGQTSNPASITVTVGSITPPTATNDSKTTPKNTAVTLAGSTNDAAGSLPIDNTSVVFPATQPAGAVVSNAGKTLTFAGQGTYQVQANGTVIFTPVSTFAGATTPVNYTMKDASGAASNAATLSVTVTNQPPVANSVTNALLTSTAPATALNPGVSGSDPDGTVVTYTVTALPSAAQGTLYCNGAAIATAPSACAPAQLSFQPNPAFNGNATFQYTVTDDNGATSNVATYTIPVNRPPVANNDTAATNPNVSVTFTVTGNDTDTAPGTVNVTSVIFDPSSIGSVTNAGKTLTVPGEGVYTANADGTVTFAPQAGFNNGASTARYTVKDNNGAISNVATITVTVPASVDLGIVKTGPAYFRPGDALSYTLTVTNSGSAATGVTVTDTLPSGLTFATATGGGGGTYNAATGKVSWTLGTVAAGSSVVLTLTGTAPTAASIETSNGPASLTNAASTVANEAEVVTSNNSASTVSQLVYPRLSKRVRNVTTLGAFGTTGTGKPAEILEYCIDFRNYGVAVATFVISDTVPTNTNADLSGYGAGLGLQVTRGGVTTRTSTSGDIDGGSLSAAALSLDLGTLAAGESGGVCFRAGIK